MVSPGVNGGGCQHKVPTPFLLWGVCIEIEQTWPMLLENFLHAVLTSLYFFSKSVLILRGGTKVNPGITSWASCFFRAHCVFDLANVSFSRSMNAHPVCLSLKKKQIK